MAYRLGTYAGHHTLYDELDPSMAASRRAIYNPISDEDRSLQWVLMQEIEERRRLEKNERGAFGLTERERVQVMSKKCGSTRCWCATNPGRINPEDHRTSAGGFTIEYMDHVWRVMDQLDGRVCTSYPVSETSVFVFSSLPLF